MFVRSLASYATLEQFNQMNTASDRLRRAQPLSIKVVGFIFDQGVTAWANWDRLIVRTEKNEVLLDHETQNYMLHSRMEFIGNRYLVVPFGTGIMLAGFKVYDFRLGQWTLDIELGTHNETGFCGAHPAAPVIAVEDEYRLDLWDLHAASRLSSIPMSDSANVATLGGPDNKIAVGTWEHIIVIDQGRETLSAQVCTGDVTALAWNSPQNSLLCGDVSGNFTQVDSHSLQVVHSFGHVNGGINKIRVSSDGKTAVAIGYDGQAIFVDCECSSVAQHEDVFDAAFSTGDTNCILVAGLAEMRRLAVSSLWA